MAVTSRSTFVVVAILCGACASHVDATGDVDATIDAMAIDGGPNDAPADASAVDTAAAACAIDTTTSLLDEMSAIVAAMRAGGGAGSAAVVLPIATDRDAFASRVLRILRGDESAACALPPSYRLVHVTDPDGGAMRLIAEVDATARPTPALYWGSFAAPRAPSASRALVLEAPHPLFDTNTELEAAAVFARTHARYLLVAGAHRCADSEASTCVGTTSACGPTGPYRESDAAHTARLPFHAIHAALSDTEGTLVFLQLHGNTQSCPSALLSDGSGTWSDVGPTGMLAAALTTGGIALGRCGVDYPTSGCNLCGTDNVQARASAGAVDACTTRGTHYGRVVHLEQLASLRATPSAGVPGYAPLVDAVSAAFPLL